MRDRGKVRSTTKRRRISIGVGVFLVFPTILVFGNSVFRLDLTSDEKQYLVEYLKSL